jgi:hypothetical protein
MKRRYTKYYDEFEELVVKTSHGCWKWLGRRDYQGYATLCGIKAARISFEKYKKKIPPKICVLHTCDNPECTKPKHLWLGTRGDNNTDRANKGRNKFEWRTLSINQVRKIRKYHKHKKYNQSELAKKYNVSAMTI